MQIIRCPSCRNTLAHEYPGGTIESVHRRRGLTSVGATSVTIRCEDCGEVWSTEQERVSDKVLA